MNLKQLEALLYVARCGTFKQAAERLYFDSPNEEYVTPESIQYRIKQLEKELGVSLYRKRQGSARVVLTREGQEFLREAIDVYQRMSEWRSMFLSEEAGWLTFASTQAVILHRLVEPIRLYHEKYPKVQLRVLSANAEEQEQLVAEGRVDFSLSTRPPDTTDLEYFLWKQTQLVLIAPAGHPLIHKRGLTLADVASHPLVLLEPELRGDRALVNEAFRRAGIQSPNIVMETSNSEIIKAYVEAGLGVSIVAETNVLRLSGRRIESAPLPGIPGRSEVGLLVRRGQHVSVRMAAFLRLLDASHFGPWLDERFARSTAALEQLETQQPGNGTKPKEKSK
ncbi:MAG: LysR substrate-binding domain-containing protein [Candidatus Sumerlaeaceae bacterium]|nr:LysR substrate-binding domain-containing protein [Candidatus Sumerlaeaceae bacterium]